MYSNIFRTGLLASRNSTSTIVPRRPSHWVREACAGWKARSPCSVFDTISRRFNKRTYTWELTIAAWLCSRLCYRLPAILSIRLMGESVSRLLGREIIFKESRDRLASTTIAKSFRKRDLHGINKEPPFTNVWPYLRPLFEIDFPHDEELWCLVFDAKDT